MTEIETLAIAPLIEKYLSLERADQYYELLMAENRSVNLVSRETSRADFDRMVAESLLPLDKLPETIGNYIDIGSGGGFPAIPLLLSGRLSGKSVLIERTGKKAHALETIARKLQLTTTVLPGNFEERARPPRACPSQARPPQADLPQADLISLRWVKLNQRLLARIMAKLSPGGSLVYYSTPDCNTKGLSFITRSFKCPQSTVIKSFTIITKTTDR